MSAIQQLLASYKAGGGDPYFANVSLLLHCDGTNGSTTFMDSSASPKTVTRTGTTVSTAQSKFGGASAIFSSPTDKLTVPSSSAFNFGADDFCVEAWIRPNSVTSDATRMIIDRGNFSDFTPWMLTQFNNNLRFAGSANATSWAFDIFADASLNVNTLYHVAGTRSCNVFRLFCNGVQIGTQTVSTTLFDGSNAVVIGNQNSNNLLFEGYMDDIRITKGVARYTSGFSVPTEAFPNS